MADKVLLEVIDKGDDVIFNMIFRDTGEIRQKRRSKDWLMRRVYQSEIKTMARRGWAKELEYDSSVTT